AQVHGLRLQIRMKAQLPRAFALPAALVVLAAPWIPVLSMGQTNTTTDLQQRLKALEESLDFTQQKLAKQMGDLMCFQRLADVAEVDKIRYTGPPPRATNNPTAQGAGNELVIAAYTFLAKQRLSTPKIPLLVLVYG